LQKDTILIVDDVGTNIRILYELLSDKYNIISSIVSTEVVELVLKHNPDLVLLDIMMPDCNGYELCKQLKSNSKTKDIPVMFITVRADEDSIEKAYSVGGIDFISKPFKPKELMMRISTQLKLKKLIDDLEKSKKQLKNLASIDSLTNIYNRRYCMDFSKYIVKDVKNKNTHISIMMLDIDNFKFINDNYGHIGGDKVLIEVAQEIKKFITNIGTVCRYGGEEFIIILPNFDVNEALKIAKKLNKNIENLKVYFNNKIINLTISIGVSYVKIDQELTIDYALKRADEALYRVKNSGKNGVEVVL